MEDKINKLPKWAQTHIHRLSMEIDSLNHTLKSIQVSEDGAKVSVQPTAYDTHAEHNYYSKARIVFELNARRGNQIRATEVGVRIKDEENGVIEVMAESGIITHSRASNVIEIKLREWHEL